MRKVASKDGPAIFADIATRARAGDPFNQRLFMHYLVPKSRVIDEPQTREPVKSVSEAAEKIADVLARLEAGAISVDDAQALIDGAKAFAEARKTMDLENEVERLRETVAQLLARVENGGTNR
jgi:hypothetical protein